MVLLLVPDPTRSVVVFPGHRAAAALLTKRPLDAERLTVRPMVITFLWRKLYWNRAPGGRGIARQEAAVSAYLARCESALAATLLLRADEQPSRRTADALRATPLLVTRLEDRDLAIGLFSFPVRVRYAGGFTSQVSTRALPNDLGGAHLFRLSVLPRSTQHS